MDESGASSTVAFLFAGVLFLAGISAVMMSTENVGDQAASSDQESRILAQQALAIRDLMLGSPGQATCSSGSVDWGLSKEESSCTEHPADALDRLGLLEYEGDSLDFQKLVNLKRAPYAADGSDGKVNYEEARDSLGLDDQGFDFHVRAYPSLKSVQELLAQGIKDSNLRVTYIGDADTKAQQQVASGGSVPTATDLACTGSPHDATTLRVSFKVANNGDDTTQFSVAVVINFDGNGNPSASDVQRGPVLLKDEVATFDVDVPSVHGDCNDIKSIDIDIQDPSATLAEEQPTPTFAAVGRSGGAGLFTVDTASRYYLEGEMVEIGYSGDLTAEKSGIPGETMTLQILNSADVDVLPAGIDNPIQVPKANDPWVFESFSAADLGAGTYTLVLERGNGETVTDKLTISATTVPGYAPTGGSGTATSHAYHDSAAAEVAFLEQLVYRFCPFVYDSQTETPLVGYGSTWTQRCQDGPYPAHSTAKEGINQYGDVLPDDNTVLKDTLPDRLLFSKDNPRYDIVNTLVVGSNSDHHTLTANAIKDSIKEWVLGGGTLIVFGSDKQVVQWLQPIFKTSIDSSSGPLSAPDEQHAMLRVADDLEYTAYDHQGRAWDLKEDTGPDEAPRFTKVVEDDDENAVLTISNPGIYEDGTVILTSWMPYDLLGDGSACNPSPTKPCDGMLVVNNLLMQGYRDLFLDYGPPIPDGVATVPADGRAQVYHPELERYVALTVRVYVFPS